MSATAIVHLLLGAAFVAFAALSRFNTPPVPSRRAMTTFFRYHLAATTYAIGLVVVYLVILLTPLVAVPRQAQIPKWVTDLPTPLRPMIATVLGLDTTGVRKVIERRRTELPAFLKRALHP